TYRAPNTSPSLTPPIRSSRRYRTARRARGVNAEVVVSKTLTCETSAENGRTPACAAHHTPGARRTRASPFGAAGRRPPARAPRRNSHGDRARPAEPVPTLHASGARDATTT